MTSLSDLLRSGGSALVLGVGRSGLAAAEVLRGRNINVFAYDDQPSHQLADERRILAQLGAELIGPQELAQTAAAAKFAIISPGVPSTNPAVRRIADAGLPVFSEIELAFQISKAPIIAVTGSKGKSTTTALIGHI
ncbi:MAG: UDP-N-acetylmuramoyl-L-alanine--D-glutamate ligase, partial [Candidatus Eremiobacteraeota bacterium]|nr:UDP-N-acetylmuramoyl-L-alanine--D-glutamate ligase [Candidatus Eremiobacteraeota bacterium]